MAAANAWVLTTPAVGGGGWVILGVFSSRERARTAAQDHAAPCFIARWTVNDPRLPLGLAGPVNRP